MGMLWLKRVLDRRTLITHRNCDCCCRYRIVCLVLYLDRIIQGRGAFQRTVVLLLTGRVQFTHIVPV